jgi:HlyD family secretion protein
MATMTANAEIVLEERKGVLAIPEGAVIYKKDRSLEVEIPDELAKSGRRRVPITAGISNGSKTQIVTGLAEGQEVVLQ